LTSYLLEIFIKTYNLVGENRLPALNVNLWSICSIDESRVAGAVTAAPKHFLKHWPHSPELGTEAGQDLEIQR
jgi:hypothetical protein